MSQNAIGFDSNLGSAVVIDAYRLLGSPSTDAVASISLISVKPKVKLKIYKKVRLKGNYSKEEEEQIKNRIENIFMNNDFNKCFDLDFDISSIEFEVNENGKVVNIVINENVKFEEFYSCVEFFVGSWDFSRMPNKGMGNYKITY